jgi:2-haloacid dehalogenase
MTNDSCDTVVFDLGGVLIDWDPRHLYRTLFCGDHAAMERFLSEVCTPAWNQQQDAGRPWAEAVAVLQEQYPEYDQLIRAYRLRWSEMVAGEIPGTVTILRALHAAGTPPLCPDQLVAGDLPDRSATVRLSVAVPRHRCVGQREAGEA